MKRFYPSKCLNTKFFVLVYAPILLSMICIVFAHRRGDQGILEQLTSNIFFASMFIGFSIWSNNMIPDHNCFDEQLFPSILWPVIYSFLVPCPAEHAGAGIVVQFLYKIAIKFIWWASLNTIRTCYLRTIAVLILSLELALISHISMVWTTGFLLITFCIKTFCCHNHCSRFATIILVFASNKLLEDISSLAPVAASPTNALSLSASVQIFEVCLFSLILVCSLSTMAYWILATTSWGLPYGVWQGDEVSVDVAVRLLVTSLIAVAVLVCVTAPCIAFITADNLAVLVAAQLYQHGCMSMFWCLVIAVSIHLASQSLSRDRIWIGPVSFPCSKTMVRKIYHIAAVTMFSPAVCMDSETLYFLSLSMGGAVCLFLAAEFVRCFLLANALSGHANGRLRSFVPISVMELLKASDAFLASFQEGSVTSSQAEGEQSRRTLMRPIIFSHISLLLGVGSPVWLYCRYAVDPLASATSQRSSATDAVGGGDVPIRPLLIIGLATVGVGDTAASVFGSLFGRLRWPGSRKTYIGTVAAFVSMAIYAVWMTASWRRPQWVSMTATFFLTALAEATTTENDNILLPLYAVAVFLSLRYCMNAS